MMYYEIYGISTPLLEILPIMTISTVLFTNNMKNLGSKVGEGGERLKLNVHSDERTRESKKKNKLGSRRNLNPAPSDLKASALPIELPDYLSN